MRSGLTKPPCCCMGHPVMLSFLPDTCIIIIIIIIIVIIIVIIIIIITVTCCALDLFLPQVMGPTGGSGPWVSVVLAAGDMVLTAVSVISETESEERMNVGPALDILAHSHFTVDTALTQ